MSGWVQEVGTYLLQPTVWVKGGVHPRQAPGHHRDTQRDTTCTHTQTQTHSPKGNLTLLIVTVLECGREYSVWEGILRENPGMQGPRNRIPNVNFLLEPSLENVKSIKVNKY